MQPISPEQIFPKYEISEEQNQNVSTEIEQNSQKKSEEKVIELKKNFEEIRTLKKVYTYDKSTEKIYGAPKNDLVFTIIKKGEDAIKQYEISEESKAFIKFLEELYSKKRFELETSYFFESTSKNVYVERQNDDEKIVITKIFPEYDDLILRMTFNILKLGDVVESKEIDFESDDVVIEKIDPTSGAEKEVEQIKSNEEAVKLGFSVTGTNSLLDNIKETIKKNKYFMFYVNLKKVISKQVEKGNLDRMFVMDFDRKNRKGSYHNFEYYVDGKGQIYKKVINDEGIYVRKIDGLEKEYVLKYKNGFGKDLESMQAMHDRYFKEMMLFKKNPGQDRVQFEFIVPGYINIKDVKVMAKTQTTKELDIEPTMVEKIYLDGEQILDEEKKSTLLKIFYSKLEQLKKNQKEIEKEKNQASKGYSEIEVLNPYSEGNKRISYVKEKKKDKERRFKRIFQLSGEEYESIKNSKDLDEIEKERELAKKELLGEKRWYVLNLFNLKGNQKELDLAVKRKEQIYKIKSSLKEGFNIFKTYSILVPDVEDIHEIECTVKLDEKESDGKFNPFRVIEVNEVVYEYNKNTKEEDKHLKKLSSGEDFSKLTFPVKVRTKEGKIEIKRISIFSNFYSRKTEEELKKEIYGRDLDKILFPVSELDKILPPELKKKM